MTKIYIVNIITGFLNVLNQLNGISRDFRSEIYILSLTMETSVALK